MHGLAEQGKETAMVFVSVRLRERFMGGAARQG